MENILFDICLCNGINKDNHAFFENHIAVLFYMMKSEKKNCFNVPPAQTYRKLLILCKCLKMLSTTHNLNCEIILILFYNVTVPNSGLSNTPKYLYVYLSNNCSLAGRPWSAKAAQSNWSIGNPIGGIKLMNQPVRTWTSVHTRIHFERRIHLQLS